MEAIAQHDITFGIGPAGTGKTYLAVAMAVSHLRARKVKRIVLTRPAVEAGEKLGFLPGDIQAKVDPYLRPLYDALFDMIDAERFEQYLQSGIIEVAPLAFMRGRTLNDAFIILDEAQNTTPEQMKMFLTRMGFSSKMVITGDVTQIDLPKQQKSGLVEATRILKGIEGIAFVYFKESDVVRHPLVARIIKPTRRPSVVGIVANKRPPRGLRPRLRRALQGLMAELGVGDKAVTVILTGDRRLRASSGSGGGRMRPPTSSPFPTTNPGTPSCPRTWGTFGSAGHRQEAGRGPGAPWRKRCWS